MWIFLYPKGQDTINVPNWVSTNMSDKEVNLEYRVVPTWIDELKKMLEKDKNALSK